MVKNLSFLLITLLICGCSTPKKTIVSDYLDATPVVTGSVVDRTAFTRGGTLLLDTFKPGTGAAADDDTDHISQMIINGINDALPGDNTHFIVSTDIQKDSNCLLDGFIDNYTSKGHYAQLAVSGQISLQDTGEKILIFKTFIQIDLKTQDPKAVAYQIGTAISHFIGSNT